MRTWTFRLTVLVAGLWAIGAHAFDPAKFAGTWSGTWKNTTFKVSGPINATVTAAPDGQTLTIQYVVALFGCGPATVTRTLTKGVDFTDAGLNFTGQDAAWGTVTVTSKTTPNVEKVSAKGGTPCNLGVSKYTFKAKVRETKLNGKMSITFAQGNKPRKAKDTFKATKQ